MATPITWDQVLTIAPELSAVSEEMRTMVLGWVETQFNERVWGSRLDAGRILLAAHVATVLRRGGDGPTGGLASESYGDVSVGFFSGTPPANATDYASTNYGREYSRIMKLNVTARVGFVV